MLDGRLRAIGLQRVRAEAHGHCQFIGVVEAAGWGQSFGPLRIQFCDAVGVMEKQFACFLFFGRDNALYVGHVACKRSVGWGDHAALAVMAQLLCHQLPLCHVFAAKRAHTRPSSFLPSLPRMLGREHYQLF